jgi:hypothetical protein
MTHLETIKSIVCGLLAANDCGVILNGLQAVKDLACAQLIRRILIWVEQRFSAAIKAL